MVDRRKSCQDGNVDNLHQVALSPPPMHLSSPPVPSKPEQAVSTLLILAASLIMRIILLVSRSLEDVDTGQQADRESCINQVSGEGVDLGEDRGE